MTVDKNHQSRYKEFLSPIECKRLSAFILAEEESVNSIPNPHPSNYEGLTGQHTVYNWLSHPTLKVLNIPQRLFDLPDFVDTTHIAIQCWMNILRQGERLGTHSHGEDDRGFYAINVFLSGNPTTGTYYEGEHSINTQGEIVIASNTINHSVPSQLFREPRISMAMDVWIDDESIEDIPNVIQNSENRIIEYYRPTYDLNKI